MCAWNDIRETRETDAYYNPDSPPVLSPGFRLDLGVLLGLRQLERARQWREDPVSAPFNPLQPTSP